jgi:hypothetical protein
MERRDAQGVLQPFASKFPSGMKALADYVHRSQRVCVSGFVLLPVIAVKVICKQLPLDVRYLHLLLLALFRQPTAFSKMSAT